MYVLHISTTTRQSNLKLNARSKQLLVNLPLVSPIPVPDMKVLDIDVFVGSRLPLAPEQETFLGGHFFNGNVLDSKALLVFSVIDPTAK
jgi:hypothetical protein